MTTKNSGQQFSGHYISGTHWDREWYRPFQEYRLLLVRLIDELLELMETSDEFKYFQLDGQTCVLQDYLEIRLENRERLARLIRDGRILIGPWFTMPDLFCPDDESLVRNLLLGRRICREWGVDPMPVGFTCDMFGHPSQMPQICAGFGLHDVVLGRGTNEHDTDMNFSWEAPDGTAVLVYKLQDKMGYAAFSLARGILEDMAEAGTELLKDREAFLAELEAAKGDPERVRQVREKTGATELARYINFEIGRANLPVIALMDSMDHVPPAQNVGGYLRLIRENCRDITPAHSTLPMFFADVRSHLDEASLQVRRGELRDPSREPCAYLSLIPNCVSARVGLKLQGDAAAALLERWAEPLVALTESDGAEPDGGSLQDYLRVAWTQVLANHAHDSVCGCSIDQVHRDMRARYDQARVLAEQLRHQAVARLTADCRELAQAKHEFTLALTNPLPFERDETICFDIDFPPDYPATFQEGFRTQTLNAFRLQDAEGNPIPYQRLSFVPVMNERSHLAKYCFISNGTFSRYTVAARVKVPACGFTSLLVKPSERPVRAAGSLRTGPAEAENEHLAIALAPNGTLILTDKASGETYRDLMLFEDRSEIGDGWFHGDSLNDTRILSSAVTAQVAVRHDGPQAVTFRVTVDMMVPRRYDWHAEAPGCEATTLTIRSDVTLLAGSRIVEVETTVDNRAEDHRLQLLLPTDASGAESYLAHTPYDLLQRRIRLDDETHDWQEMEIVEKPFQNLQAVGSGTRGLAFLSPGGLHEGGVRDDTRRTLQVTLLRSFRRTIGTEGERDGLELGPLTVRYALMPFAGELPVAEAFREIARLQTGLLTRQSGGRPSGYPEMTADGPSSQSHLQQVDGTLVLSALKPAESGTGIVLRFWNPTDATVNERLHFLRPVAAAHYCDLKEDVLSEAGTDKAAGIVTVEARCRQIVTVRITFEASG